MYADYTASGELSHEHFKKFKNIKICIYVINVFLFVVSLAAVAGCVYILVWWSFLDDIMDYDIPTAAMWVLILAGSITVVFVPLVGSYGVYRENKKLVLTNIGLLGFTFLVLVAGAVCAFVWQAEMGGWVSVKMEKSLKESYGIDLDNKYNRFITQQWDQAQKRMQCCGVLNEGWSIYRQTRWYADQPYIRDSLKEIFPGSEKHMVPTSCCRRTDKGRLFNVNKCQRFMEGPPYSIQEDGSQPEYNNAIYYEGCYYTARKHIDIIAISLMGMGIGFALLMIISIALCLVFLLMLRQ